MSSLTLSLSLAVLAAIAAGCCRGDACEDPALHRPRLFFVELPPVVGADLDAEPGADGLQLEVAVSLFDDDGSGFAEIVAAARGGGEDRAALADGQARLCVDLPPAPAREDDDGEGAGEGAAVELTAWTENADGLRLATAAAVRLVP